MGAKKKIERQHPRWLDVKLIEDDQELSREKHVEEDQWPDIPPYRQWHLEEKIDQHGRIVVLAQEGTIPGTEVKWRRYTSNLREYQLGGLLDYVWYFEGYPELTTAVIRRNKSTMLFNMIHPDTKEPVLEGTMLLSQHGQMEFLRQINSKIVEINNSNKETK